MIEFPRIVIIGVLIVLVSVFLYPISENLVYLSFATFFIALIITLLAFREMMGLVLLIFLVSVTIVTAFSGSVLFGILVGSIVAMIFVLLDVLIF